MTRSDYWNECISEAAHECGVQLTNEQRAHIAEAVQGAHENYGMAFYQPESSCRSDVTRLEKALELERSKVTCGTCGGSGTVTMQGPYHSSTSQCYICGGAGKTVPA